MSIDPQLDGWAIVVTNGVRLLGYVVAENALAPVFELSPVRYLGSRPGQIPEARVLGGFSITFPLGLKSMQRAIIPPGALWVSVPDLDAADRADLVQLLRGMEVTETRRADSRILRPGDLPPPRH